MKLKTFKIKKASLKKIKDAFFYLKIN